jgi:hypothetical protein
MRISIERRTLRDTQKRLREEQARVVRERDTLAAQLQNATQALERADRQNRLAHADLAGGTGQIQNVCSGLRSPKYTPFLTGPRSNIQHRRRGLRCARYSGRFHSCVSPSTFIADTG